MNQQIEPYHSKGLDREDGMLFVRTQGILRTMAKLPYMIAGLIILAIGNPLQTSFSSTRALDLIIYQDGSTHISSEIQVDPLEPDVDIELFGPTIDNFVVVGENGFLLSGEIEANVAKVETFGASNISVDYDTHDLVSKEGRIWTFSINAFSEFSLLMPENTVIVGMTTLPLNMEIIDEQTQLILPSGPSEINYFFGVTPGPTSIPDPDPPVNNNTFSDSVYPLILIAGAAATAGGVAAFLMKRKQTIQKTEQVKPEKIMQKPIDVETIFGLNPDLREDDKELIKFIFDNGGQAYESELRKKFLQPRTTMWRAVKRLERYDIVEIEKKELQNLVRLKTNFEEEQ